MGTTPNYAFPYPEATGLVKDGWEDIKDLATAVDTTIAAQTGLVLIKTYSPSAVSSFSFDANTFSSTYTNYKILVNLVSSSASAQALTFRMRLAGTDTTTGYYGNNNYMIYSSATINGSGFNNTSGLSLSTIRQNFHNYLVVELGAPKEARKTIILSSDYSGDDYNTLVRAIVNDTNAYDSASFIPASGTMTGTISVYGYKK